MAVEEENALAESAVNPLAEKRPPDALYAAVRGVLEDDAVDDDRAGSSGGRGTRRRLRFERPNALVRLASEEAYSTPVSRVDQGVVLDPRQVVTKTDWTARGVNGLPQLAPARER